ncbi:hypothetical protein DFA_04934 [Cavenderia fasciculata]|uniref:Heat shock protein Hsp70 family protein n=1 Tax=Cavenderia fasciculata TaxID=261658 RepID=F4PMF4_CACFS|nr:uncharacterized protein DFA_04934 [Cavenderia fasciculata]EGG22804.1 hypothetical protein DFA_04934 [Cavenderia fasciculata]|eukprot:XP_004360655.1 hypothetical protein DFA_04934 [Cavenderia fasciculata]
MTSPSSSSSSSCVLPLNKIVVISLDFGTSRSGYAYSFPSEKPDIYAHDSWPGGGGGGSNTKTLTVVSLYEDGKLSKFGYDAREDYDNAIFSNYKMVLFSSASREKTMVKADNCDQTASVQSLITETLKYLKQISLDKVRLGYTNKIEPSDVLWVITVPAIWDDAAKQIMRQCALDAGLCTKDDDKGSILFAYEPESGALDCIFEKTNSYSIREGETLLVFDLGGGTADFTGYKQLAGDKISSIVTRFGGDYGSNECNENFKKFLLQLLGDEFPKDMIEGNDFMQVMDKFESVKTSMNASSYINDSNPRSILFNPRTFGMTFDWLLERIEKYNTANASKIEYRRSGSLVIPMETFMTFLQPLFKNIVDCVKKKMLECPAISNPNFIFMIGGFSENYFLQELVKKEFASTGAKIMMQTRPSLSVVKGACRFGLRPSVVTSRHVPRSYAVEIVEEIAPENEHLHADRKVFFSNGKFYVKNVCSSFVRAGQSVGIDEVVVQAYQPLSATATQVAIAIFTSQLPDIKYTTDPGISFAAEIIVPLPPGDTIDDKSVHVLMKFGNTEVLVSAVQIKSRAVIEAKIDFAMTQEEAERRNQERLNK